MDYNDSSVRNLEQLLESLIKMVGKANQNVDRLQRRVSQLERLLVEQHQPEAFIFQTSSRNY